MHIHVHVHTCIYLAVWLDLFELECCEECQVTHSVLLASVVEILQPRHLLVLHSHYQLPTSERERERERESESESERERDGQKMEW